MSLSETKVFRVFFSSTFSDFQEERNELQKVYFPMLDKFCRENGAVFQPVDLRWGISNEASLDNRTLEICLSEVNLCHEISPRPSFVMLLGNRYGWCPVPPSVPAEIFEKASLSDFAKSRYIKDTNAIPAVYHLRRREGIYTDPDEWDAVEEKLRREWETVFGPLMSATEEEIRCALNAPWEDRRHIFCFKRVLESIPLSEQGAPFTDLTAEYAPDKEKEAKRAELEKFIRSKLPEENIEVFHAEWERRSELVSVFCKKIADSLLESIKEELKRLRTLDIETESEISEAAFSGLCAECFTGHDSLISRLNKNLLHGEEIALVCGDCGKSALSAKMGSLLRDAGHNVIVRHAKQSVSAADMKGLLSGICRKLKTEPSDEISYTASKICEALKNSDTFLILDGIDRYPEAAAVLQQLLSCRHVMATVSNRYFAEALGCKNTFDILPLTENELFSLFDAVLSKEHRTLTSVQRDAFLSSLRKNPDEAFCKLLARRAAMLQSTDAPIYADTPKELADSIFSAMTDTYNHDPVLVEHILGLLACVEEITPVDLTEMAMRDRESYSEWSKQLHHQLPREEIPINVISRLYYDLSPYLLHKPYLGQDVVCFASKILQDRAYEKYAADDIAVHALNSYLSRNQNALSSSELSRIPFLLSRYRTGKELAEWLISYHHIRDITVSGMLPGIFDELALHVSEPEIWHLQCCLQENRDALIRCPDAHYSIIRIYAEQHSGQKGVDRLSAMLPVDKCMYADCYGPKNIRPYLRIATDNTHWVYCRFTENGDGLTALRLDGSFSLFDLKTGKVSSSVRPAETKSIFMYGCCESKDSLVALSRDHGVFRLKAPDYEKRSLEVSAWEKLDIEGESFFGMTEVPPLTIGRSVPNKSTDMFGLSNRPYEVELLQIADGKTEVIPLDFLDRYSPINCIALSEDSSLAIAFMDGQIAATTGLYEEKEQMDGLIACTFYDRDTGIAACSASGKLYCYNAGGGLRFKADISIPGLLEQHCECILWDETRRLLIIGHRNGWVTVFPPDKPLERKTFYSGVRQGVLCMALSPDKSCLVLGGRGGFGSGLSLYRMDDIASYDNMEELRQIYGEISVSGCKAGEEALFLSQYKKRMHGDLHIFSVSPSNPANYRSVATADCYAWNEQKECLYFSRGSNIYIWADGNEQRLADTGEYITGMVCFNNRLILVSRTMVTILNLSAPEKITFRLEHPRERKTAPIMTDGKKLYLVCETDMGECIPQPDGSIEAHHPESFADVYDLTTRTLAESAEYDGFCNFIGQKDGKLLIGLGAGRFLLNDRNDDSQQAFLISSRNKGAFLCDDTGRTELYSDEIACGLSEHDVTVLVSSYGDARVMFCDGTEQWITVCAGAIAVYRSEDSLFILDNGEQSGGMSRLHKFLLQQ